MQILIRGQILLKRGNDANLGKDNLKPLENLGGPMTRSRAKKAKETLEEVATSLLTQDIHRLGFKDSKNLVLFCIFY